MSESHQDHVVQRAHGKGGYETDPPPRSEPSCFWPLGRRAVWVVALLVVGAVQGVLADDSCQHALDSECDEPSYCVAGTDSTDCSVAGGTQDVAAALDDSCRYARDGACDVPALCEAGTDQTDCSAAALPSEALQTQTSNTYPFASEEPSNALDMLGRYSAGSSMLLYAAFAIGAFLLWRARPFAGRLPLAAGLGLLAIGWFAGPALSETGLGVDSWALTSTSGVVAGGLLVAGIALLVGSVGTRSSVAMATFSATLGDSASMQQVVRSEANAITACAAAIQELETRLRATLERLAIAAEVFPTTKFDPSHSLRVVLNELRNGSIGVRASLLIQALPKEYHRYPAEFTVQVENTLRTRTYTGILNITDSDLEALCNFLAGRTHRPRFRPLRARQWALQLWRPANRQMAVAQLGWLLVLGLIFVVLLAPAAPRLAALAFLGAGVMWFVHHLTRLPPLALSAGKPVEEPRRLVRLDSWHAVVGNLATHTEAIRSAFINELRTAQYRLDQPAVADYGGASELSIAEEKIWYESSDGRMQRIQTVVRLRRAIAFVHLYCYGRDAFFAWDAHINAASWANVPLATGRHSESGKTVTAYTLAPRWTAPNEYDLADANFLAEFVHANLASVIRRAMKEHQIDQEVDFKIVRASREGVVGRSDPAASRKALSFKRTG